MIKFVMDKSKGWEENIQRRFTVWLVNVGWKLCWILYGVYTYIQWLRMCLAITSLVMEEYNE